MTYQATGYNPGNVAAGSAIQEDDHRLDMLESEVADHPTHTSGFAENGDAVSFGDGGVGVIVNPTVSAVTEIVVVQTRGVFNLLVEGHNGTINTAIAVGDKVYLQTDGTIDVDNGGTLLGLSMSVVVGAATGVAAAVKVGAQI